MQQDYKGQVLQRTECPNITDFALFSQKEVHTHGTRTRIGHAARRPTSRNPHSRDDEYLVWQLSTDLTIAVILAIHTGHLSFFSRHESAAE